MKYSKRIGSRTALSIVVLAGALTAVISAPDAPDADAAKPASQTVIACFHPKIRSFTPESHPSECTIPGYRGKEFVEVPVKGMRWGHWGSKQTRAAYGNQKRNGKAIRLIAFRPIACEDGRTWYSQVMVDFPGTGEFFGLRLPTCDDPAEIKPLPPPKARTTRALGVEGSSALVTGIINPRGRRTVFRFQWGLTRSYGQIAPEVVEEGWYGSEPREVEEVLDCLRPNTTYHFRIVAYSRSGKTFGGDRTFTTTRLHASKSHLYAYCPGGEPTGGF